MLAFGAAEDGRQRSEVGKGQRTEDGRQRTEDGKGQRSEVTPVKCAPTS